MVLSLRTEHERVVVDGVAVDACTEQQVVTAVRMALDRGLGGRIITPNVDILRQARTDPEVRGHLADASLVVADGMPLVWAGRLAGTPLPERVAGASLIWSLARGLGRDGRSVYLLGGEPGPAGAGSQGAGSAGAGSEVDAGDGAARAARRLAAAAPGLRIAGWHSPGYGFERDPAGYARVRRRVVEARPDLVYVGLGFPKQERVIAALRAELPGAWFLGCGMAINFVAGERARAPRWMQRAGLEWAHRLASEPRRLASRYVRHDAPYALRLLARAALTRRRR